MLDWLNRFIDEAKGKLTVYLGLLIASASEIRENWNEMVGTLPQWKWLQVIEHHAFAILGIFVVYARVRRTMKRADDGHLSGV